MQRFQISKMKSTILLLLLTIVHLQNLPLSLALAVDEELDTFSIDATTVIDTDPEVTSTPESPTSSSPSVQPAKVHPIRTGTGNNALQCTTTRGKPGHCSRVSDCFTLVVSDNGTVPLRNRVLVEMLIESSGFCDGTTQARSDFTATIMEQVIRSEILLCCPESASTPPPDFNPEDVDMNPDNSVYDEMYMGRSCGYPEKQSTTTTTEAPTTTTTVPPPVVCPDPALNCSKIVKGRKTKIGEFPWMVAMMNKGRQFCGGSLINQNTVLTAAHCVQHMTPRDVKNLRLQIGDYNIYTTNDVKHEARGVRAIKYHKGFSMKHLMHDIAILILDRPVQYSKTIQAVCLHSGVPDPADGTTKADVAGWGSLSEGGGQPSDLRAVTVRVLTREECVRRYASSSNKIGKGMVCAGADKGEDSCQGDSGGPLTIDSAGQAKQIGVVSWGIGCGRYPGVYTGVYHYLKWINTNMVKDMGYQ